MTATFAMALQRLAALEVPGVRRSYGIDAIPEALGRAQLPALLVLPIDIREERLFGDRRESLQMLAFSGSAATVLYTTTHLLLIAPRDSGMGIRSHLPSFVTLTSAYYAALRADVTLDGALLEPARVRTEPGVFDYGGVPYYGCAFRHTWLLPVEST